MKILNPPTSDFTSFRSHEKSSASEVSNEAGPFESRSVKMNSTNRQIQSIEKLSPINQYEYFDDPDSFIQKLRLRNILGNPEATLKEANDVISKAMLPPVFSNPDRHLLNKALQLKRIAESQLNIAA